MPELDLTVTISVILALAAIISPIFTTFINNHYQIRIKKMEMKQKQYEQSNLYKRKIFEDFLRSFNKICQLPTEDNLAYFSESYSLAYIYLPECVQKDLGKINLLIKAHHWDEVIKYVDAISMDICKEMQKL